MLMVFENALFFINDAARLLDLLFLFLIQQFSGRIQWQLSRIYF